jgi:hypothetical protein
MGMTMVGWSPSEDRKVIEVNKTAQREELSLFGTPIVEEFVNRTPDNPAKAELLGLLFHLEGRMKESLLFADTNEIASILEQLDALAVEGQQERATLQRMEVETTNIRATEAGLENELRSKGVALANIRAARPGQFSTRADLARWDAKLSAAEAAAREAEADLRAYGYALPSHLQNLEAQKIRVGQLQGKDKSLRSRLAFLRGEPAPEAASGFSNTATGLR